MAVLGSTLVSLPCDCSAVTWSRYRGPIYRIVTSQGLLDATANQWLPIASGEKKRACEISANEKIFSFQVAPYQEDAEGFSLAAVEHAGARRISGLISPDYFQHDGRCMEGAITSVFLSQKPPAGQFPRFWQGKHVHSPRVMDAFEKVTVVSVEELEVDQLVYDFTGGFVRIFGAGGVICYSSCLI